MIIRQTEAHWHPRENEKVRRWRSRKALKENGSHWRNVEVHTFEKPRVLFITEEVSTNLCLFFFFFLNLILIKLGLSQTCTVNFRKETSRVSKKKLTEAMTCNSITEKESSKVGKGLNISRRYANRNHCTEEGKGRTYRKWGGIECSPIRLPFIRKCPKM